MKFAAEAIEQMREDLFRIASGALTRGEGRAAIGATDAVFGPLVRQEGAIPTARDAFREAVEIYTGGLSLTAALVRSPAEDEALLNRAMDTLRAFSAALETATPTLQAKDRPGIDLRDVTPLRF